MLYIINDYAAATDFAATVAAAADNFAKDGNYDDIRNLH